IVQVISVEPINIDIPDIARHVGVLDVDMCDRITRFPVRTRPFSRDVEQAENLPVTDRGIFCRPKRELTDPVPLFVDKDVRLINLDILEQRQLNHVTSSSPCIQKPCLCWRYSQYSLWYEFNRLRSCNLRGMHPMANTRFRSSFATLPRRSLSSSPDEIRTA